MFELILSLGLEQSLTYKDNERVRLISRDGRDHTRRFCDIAVAISKVSARSSVL